MADYDANATPNMNFFIPIQPDIIIFLSPGMFFDMDYCTCTPLYVPCL